MRVKFGLALDFWSTTKPLPELLDDYTRLLELAEAYGFDSVWAGENRPQSPEAGHVPSPLLVLASLARSTNLRIGTGVTLVTVWHPLRLAYDAAILDQISGGRFILGVGMGAPNLMRRYGIPPEEAAARMDEALSLLKALWSGEDRFRGNHFTVDGGVYPAPIQAGGPPIWIGGTIRRSIERAVEFGHAWYGATQYHFNLIKKQAQTYRNQLAEAGQDPSNATVAINRTSFVAETDKQARQEGRPYVRDVLNFYGRYGLLKNSQGKPLDASKEFFDQIGDDIYFCGSPGTCIKSIRRYRDEAGVNHFNLRITPGNMPFELAARTITLLGEQVLPKFR